MFTLSKIFIFLTDFGFIVPALLCLGAILLWTRWNRAGRWVVSATMSMVVAFSIFPVGSWLIAVLEDRFPVLHEVAKPVTGIVTLGGTISQFMTAARGQPALTDGAERLTEFVALARAHPEARLVFSGGSGSLTRQDIKEADSARLFFRQMGLDVSHIIFERQSRNTFENATLTHNLVKPGAGERWVLITSAMHMPRAIGAFRKAGWSPIPYPVDFQTFGPPSFTINPEVRFSGIGRLSIALREWMALAIYRFLGRTKALFPAPER
jgi:uncharacterized SAM-binding protein YcdF (DUF218 family)